MHHKPKTRQPLTTFVRCYLDESGTHASASHAVVAGFVTDRDRFLSMDDEWFYLLARHGIESPLHMNEFGLHGRHGRLDYNQRKELFSEAVGIVNRHKIYSIAASVSREQYESVLPVDIRKVYSQYGFCFLLCAFVNHIILTNHGYEDDIPYILHHGNSKRKDIDAAHEAYANKQMADFPLHMGSLTYDSGTKLSTLQAADMIAWGVYRRLSHIPLNKGFGPISGLFKIRHEEHEYEDKAFQWLADKFHKEEI
jgi:hypothetical protein